MVTSLKRPSTAFFPLSHSNNTMSAFTVPLIWLLLVAEGMAGPIARSGGSSSTGICDVPSKSTYQLPSNFDGNTSHAFLQTASLPPLISHCENATIISYDSSFAALFAPGAKLDLIYTNPEGKPVADEMGIWLWDHNQVWMASASQDNVSYVSILDLKDHSVRRFNTSNGVEVLNPNGGGYHNGTVYIAGDGSETVPPCIYAVNPVTFAAEVVIDSYFGLRFGGPNDLTWATRGNSSWLFFSDDPLSALYNNGQAPQVPDAVWRYDPGEQTVLPVIDRTDALVPNGIRVDKNSAKLYLTDTPSPLVYGAGVIETSEAQVFAGSASSAIYVFDISSDGFPSNRRLFGIAERGIADGLHLDDFGNVWTGEADGIVVRNPAGKLLGTVNALAIQGAEVVDAGQSPLQNFALAGDLLVVMAFDKIYTIQLSSHIVSGMT